ncbi:glycosyltransferase family 1 protein [Glaciihabitans sp. dw_435]|uniref:glycosyltransferase family 4 protein n=1 Tax=Glaciihabitans sp. dw_435 TaxID=2720081 RepID=UPI001BD5523D|nr:glycosyltransferase family 1 protein [Glaciihabitans sp. dw_435]
MKILFDCRYIKYPRHDGISRFSAGLVTALGRLHPVTMVISDERQLSMLPDLPWVLGPSPTAITEPAASLYFNKFEPDVVYTPMQTMGPWGRRFRLVTTVHDLIYYSNRTPPRNLIWPVRVVWRLYHLSWAPQRALLRKADAHVSVSETTKQLMLSKDLTPHPIVVVPNAVEDPLVQRDSVPTGRDLLYMGSFMPYKNVELLATAMHLLPGYHLHLLSRASAEDKRRLERLAPVGSMTFHDGASDEEYGRLLSEAFAVVTASRNEGFGLPLLESMVTGTPVVASDIPVFREIAGESALFFDVDDPQDFANTVRRLEDGDEWMTRSAESRERTETYRWNNSAAILLDLLTRDFEESTAKNRTEPTSRP